MASHTHLEQLTKKFDAWKNKWEKVGPKNLVKPTSLTDAVTIHQRVICEKFVAPHPKQIMASSLLAD